MKKNIIFLLLCPLILKAQVTSTVYSFEKPAAVEKGKIEKRMHFIGETLDFETLSMESFLFHKNAEINLQNNLMEQLVIVKSGTPAFSFGQDSKTMGPGSISVLMPGESLSINASKDAEIYLMKYKAKEGQSLDRGNENGGSFMIDWNNVSYKTHDKGGIRKFYDKPTAACKRMEMHVSNLNLGIKSHEPHTHRAPEIILMIKGKSEMEIDGKVYPAKTGDIYFVESMVPHAIKNIDTEQIQYFAYQFE